MFATLAILAVLAALLVLVVPIDLSFRFHGVEALEAQVAIGWLFGLIHRPVRLTGNARRARPSDAQAKRGGRRTHLAFMLRQAAFRRRLIRLAGDLFRAARFRDLGLRLRLGLGDPADTGRLWALVGPLTAAAGRLPNAQISIEPEFIDTALEFDLRGRIVIVPLRVLALVIAFALSPPSIRAWRSIRGSRA
jgi:hypothetical protein